jgi:L-lactate dehydrogenase complex protein LldE
LVDQLMPEVGVAAVRLLRRAGVLVEFPRDQTCCGQPFFNSGFHPEAVRLAKRTIKIFEDQAHVVLPSGSCTAMIRVEYPHLFEDSPEWAARARALAAKTYELSEYLVNKLRWEPVTKETVQVTCHDSCHACRLLGLKDEPRKLLAGSGCELREMTESDRCCGFGGLFSARIPEVSNAMTREKLSQAEATGATTLVTIDPGCLMQMQGLAGESGVKPVHLATLLEARTR